MIQFLQQKKATLVLIGLVSIMVVLMSQDAGNRGATDLAGDLLFKAGTPAVRAGSSITTFFSDMLKGYVDLRGVKAENRRLADALLRTERERDRLRELAGSGERLQSLLALRQTLQPPGIAARIAGSGFASGGDTILLDRGSSDGLAGGMPVIAVGGAVGRIVTISADLAKVQCITDPASGVAVVMQESGYQGILFGTGKGGAEIHYLPPYAEVAHGDLVVTSGLDQIYPRGIPVGRVVGVPQGEGVARRYEVKPLVDFQRISEVLVLRAPARLPMSDLTTTSALPAPPVGHDAKAGGPSPAEPGR